MHAEGKIIRFICGKSIMWLSTVLLAVARLLQSAVPPCSIDLIHACSCQDYVITFRHYLPDGKLQKVGRVLCFTARSLCTMAKGNSTVRIPMTQKRS